MKIDKKLLKELVDNLKEFNLTELEYQEGQTKIKVSKASKGIEQIQSSSIVSQNKAVLKNSEDSEGIRVKISNYWNCLFSSRTRCKKICIRLETKLKKGKLS